MPNSSDSISIVMATYNGAPYIRAQLESIAAQTLKPYEIIIQDDCSSDNTVNIITEFMPILPIKLHINSKNLGYIHNFEIALLKAEGNYIALCDQDDIWKPNKLKNLIKNIASYSLVYSDSELIDAEGKPLHKTLSQKLRNRFISTHSPLSFVYDNCVSAHAMLFKKELLASLLPFPNHLYFDAWIAACAANLHGVYFLNESLVGYRQHSSNTLSKNSKQKHSFGEKLRLKTAKRLDEHQNRVQIISDLLLIPTLNSSSRELLKQLLNAHKSFQKICFNFNFFVTLIYFRQDLFAITKKNPFTLAFKKSIGLKLYRFFPFL